MSFMYDPIPYDDDQAINHISIPSSHGVMEKEERAIKMFVCNLLKEESIILIDGYIAADFDFFINAINAVYGSSVECISIEQLMKSEDVLREALSAYLPIDLQKDPASIFGKLYPGSILDFMDKEKVKAVQSKLKADNKRIVIYGYGSSIEEFRVYAKHVIYIDLTPKDAVLRAQKGHYKNIGETHRQSFGEMLRRYYFVDVEILMKHRKELIQNKAIEFYVLETWKDNWQLLDSNSMYSIFRSLSKRPFRSKPIYLQGVWGGEYIRKIRNLPKDIAPCIAWVFEFIPLEASIAVAIDHSIFDIPFYTFLNAEENSILGEVVREQFSGNFPIRFNYDDTWHSNGNMSIQVHPDREFACMNYNEPNSQDEAYYVVHTGQDAKTYCGFKETGSGFLDLCTKAQADQTLLDYESYVNGIPSHVGMQVMIPAGTVHASGRNQLVLELGSFTVGAYTYKMYDYNRKDLNDELRPIHLYNASKVLDECRNKAWVQKHCNIEPILFDRSQDYEEYIIGSNETMYYETHRIHLHTDGIYKGENHGQFSVLSVVDGEEVNIYDAHNPSHCYNAKYLDVITLPASISEYIVEAKGYQPVVLHKTILVQKEGETL